MMPFNQSSNQSFPQKKKMVLDLMDDAGKKQHDAVKMNQKAMMQFALSFSTVPLLNKLNCKKQKDKANWPNRKAHNIMSVIVKEFEPEDTMAKMEMESALAKLKLGPKKDLNELMDEFASLECQYLLELTESKKKAQILRLGGLSTQVSLQPPQ
jgi:hypothetical protein